MALREHFENTGNWLFRWRSYLPLLLIVLVVCAILTNASMDSEEGSEIPVEMAGLFISFLGLGVRVLVVGYKPKRTSGSNTTEQVADVLNTTGMYSIVRHPLYLGNFILWFGISLLFSSWEITAITCLIFIIYYERSAFAEEEFLRKRFGDRYLAWDEKTAAFIPRFRNWQSPELSFSFKKVIGKEYAGFFAIICAFTAIELIDDLLTDHVLEIDPEWKVIFCAGLGIYLALRFLKRRTRLLDTPDR
ncbi:methyltransferase family protein [Thermodesulfobacteriota bacterium]